MGFCGNKISVSLGSARSASVGPRSWCLPLKGSECHAFPRGLLCPPAAIGPCCLEAPSTGSCPCFCVKCPEACGATSAWFSLRLSWLGWWCMPPVCPLANCLGVLPVSWPVCSCPGCDVLSVGGQVQLRSSLWPSFHPEQEILSC